MDALILFALLVAATGIGSVLLRRALTADAARARIGKIFEQLQADFTEAARMMGEAFIPALREVGRAMNRFAAAYAASQSRRDQ